MNNPKYLLVLVTVAVLLTLAFAQQGNAPPTVRIITPRSGEKVTNTFVNVQYEVTVPTSAAGSPTFQLRLDGRDPVRTTETQHTFTGLGPGSHSILIEVVDANNTPLPGARNEVQFTVVQGQGRPGNQRPGGASEGAVRIGTRPRLQFASLLLQTNVDTSALQQAGMAPSSLRASGSSLPLLSVIGMGVLVGGIASALRTRNRGSRIP